MNPLRFDELNLAAKDNDEDADKFGLDEALLEAGLDSMDAKYIASSRAIHAVLVATGDEEALRQINSGRDINRIYLSEPQRELLALATAAVLDGLAISARAAKEFRACK